MIITIKYFIAVIFCDNKSSYFYNDKPQVFMKISYNWLKEILDFVDPILSAEVLTEIGLEVERVETHENIKEDFRVY